jgi:tryptophan synthase beta chain
MKDGYMEALDIEQNESFKAGVLFAQTEGIIPAPESCHAIAATVREALKCKETGNQKTILFNLSGHGFVDMAAYDQYISGELQDFHISDAELAKYMASADALNK